MLKANINPLKNESGETKMCLRIPKNNVKNVTYMRLNQIWLVEDSIMTFTLKTVKGTWNTEDLIESILEHEFLHKTLLNKVSLESHYRLDNISMWQMISNKPKLELVSHETCLHELCESYEAYRELIEEI